MVEKLKKRILNLYSKCTIWIGAKAHTLYALAVKYFTFKLHKNLNALDESIKRKFTQYLKNAVTFVIRYLMNIIFVK